MKINRQVLNFLGTSLIGLSISGCSSATLETRIDEGVYDDLAGFVNCLPHDGHSGYNIYGVAWILGEKGVVLKKSEIVGVPSFDFEGNGRYVQKEYGSNRIIGGYSDSNPIENRRIEFVNDKEFYVIKRPFVVRYGKDNSGGWQRSVAQFWNEKDAKTPEKLRYGKKNKLSEEKVLKYLKLREKIDNKADAKKSEPLIF